MDEVFKNVDCIELYVSDLDDGIKYYCGSMGLKLLWRTEPISENLFPLLLQRNRQISTRSLSVSFCSRISYNRMKYFYNIQISKNFIVSTNSCVDRR